MTTAEQIAALETAVYEMGEWLSHPVFTRGIMDNASIRALMVKRWQVAAADLLASLREPAAPETVVCPICQRGGDCGAVQPSSVVVKWQEKLAEASQADIRACADGSNTESAFWLGRRQAIGEALADLTALDTENQQLRAELARLRETPKP